MKKILLTIVLVGAFVFTSCGGSGKTESKVVDTTTQAVTVAAVTEVTLKNVGGLCEMCKERIETAAKSVDGVNHAMWHANTKELDMKFDAEKTSIDKISSAIAMVGHDTDAHKADDAVYDALPSCCKYR